MDNFLSAVEVHLLLDEAEGELWSALVGLLCGYSLREIARKLGVPLTTLRRKLQEVGRD